ncbi:dihydropteroate synthase [Sphingobacterium sp. WQ 366]|uniref:Dihydropteroate synthase n=2 Tax=Sphingobacterium bovistauri TaxID=2781959 RepID=A0ABS7Z4L0_9SPHI|nr:dihydropteroate synthase [Sphingobacterium bovistauri]MCA5003909.1 dihydropteroate synthase [Sphingobacterium bovistauri]
MNIFKTYPCQSINLKGKLLTFDKPIIMGILNITPDSFFDGGKHNSVENALTRVAQMIEEGVDIIDIGAYSSRPGAPLISAQEEIDRAIPVIESIKRKHPHITLSIDTFRSDVARKAIQAGAHIINDISGGILDDSMFQLVAELQVPYILMHMRGTPETMQHLTDYNDIVNDVAVDLGKKISKLRALGVKDIILDPGYGFAKTMAQNYELLLRVNELHYHGLPILGGISRKSMIYKKLEITPQESLSATTSLNTLLLERGVQILRVHDVKEAKQLTQLLF